MAHRPLGQVGAHRGPHRLQGTPEANKVAGEQRATAAKDYLVKAGVTETRIQIVSYGSDRPVCPQKTAACAARNRRVHFLVKPQ